jgi:hypothetical protein
MVVVATFTTQKIQHGCGSAACRAHLAMVVFYINIMQGVQIPIVDSSTLDQYCSIWLFAFLRSLLCTTLQEREAADGNGEEDTN